MAIPSTILYFIPNFSISAITVVWYTSGIKAVHHGLNNVQVGLDGKVDDTGVN